VADCAEYRALLAAYQRLTGKSQNVIENLMKKALLIGSNGNIGSALATQMSDNWELHTISQTSCDYSEAALQANYEELKPAAPFSLIINCIGTLHNDKLSPEKRLQHLNETTLAEYFRINTIIPSLCLRFFLPLLDKQNPSVYISLSAMVGSISDNQLGGWYGYRSSKAALNMMVKTASIELKRTNKQACLAVVHPGTTQGPLSKPFASGIDKDKYYTPSQTAERLLQVAEGLSAGQTGRFFNWDGTDLDW